MSDVNRRIFLIKATQASAAGILLLAWPFRGTKAQSRVALTRQTARLPAGADCAKFLQDAIDKLPPAGGEIVVGPGEYMIDAVRSISLRSHVTLRFMPGAVLRALPNALPNYAMLRIHDVVNVQIDGGTLVGERDHHLGNAGEWGMGLDIRGSHDVVVQDMQISNCWGDGIYIGSSNGADTGACVDITLRRLVVRGNRRQGLSIVCCHGGLVEQCEFSDTAGTAPAAGIDMEPNAGNVVSNVRIVNCIVEGNQGDGFQFYAAAAGARILDCSVEGGASRSNHRYGVSMAGTTRCKVDGADILENGNFAVYVQKTAQDSEISAKSIRGNLSGSMGSAALSNAMAGGFQREVKVEAGARNVRVTSSDSRG